MDRQPAPLGADPGQPAPRAGVGRPGGASGRLTPAQTDLRRRVSPRPAPPVSLGPALPPRAGLVLSGSARTQRGSATSSTVAKTTRTGSPMRIVAGSIALIGPVGVLDEVADHADRRVLVERDDDHVVGRELGVGGQQRRVRDDERPDRRPPRRRAPRCTSSRPAVAGTSVGAGTATARSGRRPARAARRGDSPPRTRRCPRRRGRAGRSRSPRLSSAAAGRWSARPRRS